MELLRKAMLGAVLAAAFLATQSAHAGVTPASSGGSRVASGASSANSSSKDPLHTIGTRAGAMTTDRAGRSWSGLRSVASISTAMAS